MQIMNGSVLGAISVVLNIVMSLLIFGHFYDRKIASLGANGEGWSWLQVVIGVFVTLIGIGLLDLILPWNAFFTGLLGFAASGAPMCWGAIQRHVEAQERARKAMNE